MRRLLIYLTYDKQNIIDDYIGYFLHSMRAVASSVIVVCNMPGIEKGLYNLTDHADSIFYRENVGLDAGGFKDALCTYVGWDRLREYDELILANDSFYGPFDDIRKIFAEMESRNLDFWGLMKGGPREYGANGKDPEHILSFFYVFQSPLLYSEDFRSYWEEMPYYRDYMEVVKKYERQLTRHFAVLGYRYDTYADTAVNESRDPKNQFFQCDCLAYEMMKKRNFPFLKRKQMAYNTLYCQTQENAALSIEYIDKETDYDVNLIWNNLIRTQHPSMLQRSLGLQYILEDVSEKPEKRYDGALICIRACWKNAAETVCEYLERIEEVCDVRIYTDCTDVAECYRERGFAAILSACTDVDILRAIDIEQYQYICLIHDADLSSERIPSRSGKSYFFSIWENLLKNAGHIASVIKLLETKPYIGMLMTPVPIFGTWLGDIGFEWEQRYAQVQGYLDKLKIHAVTDPEIPPVNVTDNFWIKADVLKTLAEKPGLPDQAYCYLWNYIAQGSGYLTGVVESAFYASMNETNYHYYLRTLIGWFTERYGAHQKLSEFREIFHVQWAVEKCRERHEKWYVYGTGEIADRCFAQIQNTDGFIVSDGMAHTSTFHGKPVMYLSELDPREECGVVLCLNKGNQNKVVRLLEEKGFKNYYVIN